MIISGSRMKLIGLSIQPRARRKSRSAQRAADLIQAAGLTVHLDDDRGFDHGVFAPMAVMYPKADVPVFQVSLRSNYNVTEHFALGRALAPLRDEGVLIVGSGLSYHNLRLFGPDSRTPSMAFDVWLNDALAMPPQDRVAELEAWEAAPYARVCHPAEDHLVPLFAALGAAQTEVAHRVYHEENAYGGVTASSCRFG